MSISLYSALTEENYVAALALARDSDEKRARGEPTGALEGLPISVKDHYNMEGFDNTCGIAYKCFKPAKKTGAYVQTLLDAGAIPIVRSNVPQLMMLPER